MTLDEQDEADAQRDELWSELAHPLCEYFALCAKPAHGLTSHPILDVVPTCDSCADRFELRIQPWDELPDGVLDELRALARRPFGFVGDDVRRTIRTYIATGDV